MGWIKGLLGVRDGAHLPPIPDAQLLCGRRG